MLRRGEFASLREVRLQRTGRELQQVLVAAELDQLGVDAANERAVAGDGRARHLHPRRRRRRRDGRGRRSERRDRAGRAGRRGGGGGSRSRVRGGSLGGGRRGGGGGGRRRLRAPLEQDGEAVRAFIGGETGAHRAERPGRRARVRDARRERADRDADVLEALLGVRGGVGSSQAAVPPPLEIWRPCPNVGLGDAADAAEGCAAPTPRLPTPSPATADSAAAAAAASGNATSPWKHRRSASSAITAVGSPARGTPRSISSDRATVSAHVW